jgi:chromosome segregation protein
LRIKSLELNGFKSFIDRTVLQFERGITAVVGPNGCGKSNVVDGMRWAMGEQSPRRLRGKSMEDVIFAGSEGRAPVNVAEVVITFDNSDGGGPPAYAAYTEIQVARRLYRSGESEYYLNKTPCRLRDVHDLFRDSGMGSKGYTIVEQGHIAEIVSAKPEERRELIEEAAGIGKYKARRREAESKIRSTEQNLLRVTDVLAEIRRQINAIERQARKAARYKRLRETWRVLELSLAADDRRALVAETDDARERQRRLLEEVSGAELALAARELALEQRRIELTEHERVLSQDTEVLLALRGDIKDCEGRIEYGRRERENHADTIAARLEELGKLREKVIVQQAEAADAGAELGAVETAVESERELVARAEAAAKGAREDLQALERERDVANAALVEVLTTIARAEDRLAALDDRRAAIDARLRSADESLEVGQAEASRADQEQRSLEEGLRNLLAERDRLMTAVRAALESHERAAAHAREAGLWLRERRETRETRRARLASLREVLERRDDVGAGTRALLAADEGARRGVGVRALVRDVLEVDRDAERAVEAVLAERAEAVVVDDLRGAVAGLDWLRSAGAGRGVFVALPEPASEGQGFVPLGQPLLARVRTRPGFEALARRLLGGVNLVDSLEQVLEVYGAGRIPALFVTPDGSLLTPEGVVSGGSTEAGSGHVGRVREVRELEGEVAALEAAADEAEAAHAAAESALARSADELDNLRNRHHTAALAVANHEKDLERTRERVKALGEAHEGRMNERSELLAGSQSLVSERDSLEQRLSSGRRERAERQQKLDALGLRIGSAGRDVLRLETAATERRIEHAGRAERRDRLRIAFERAGAAAQETRAWIVRREQEIAAAEARREELAVVIRDARATLDMRLQQEEAARASLDAKREAYDRVGVEVTGLESEVRGARSAISAQRDAAGQAELAVRESELRLAHLQDGVRERWDVDLASWTPPPLEPEPAVVEEAAAPGAEAAPEAAAAESVEEEEPAPDAARDARANARLARLPRDERRAELEDVRKRIQALGDVNLGAIEEHEELSERFRFLSEQKADLDASLASLHDAIQRINRTSRKRFRETFEAVSKRFSENFPRLFRGGKASLSLTETEDVLEAGIEIMAMPPGKRLQNVNLLSGGEKTLTAIALLIAIFQVRPSPFFLLDEVDAALDDANVGRFNEIVRELAADSQFVLITHNKRTIEVADVLYGVTMERKGISKLVSVELH